MNIRVERAQLIASYGLSCTPEHIRLNRDNMALGLHNTAERDGVRLDEKLATVCRLRNGRIAEIETFLSDVPGMNRFPAARPTDFRGFRSEIMHVAALSSKRTKGGVSHRAGVDRPKRRSKLRPAKGIINAKNAKGRS